MSSRKRATLVHASVVLALGASLTGACTADLSTVQFQMPPKIFRFTTTSVIWSTAPATLPSVSCSVDADCCQPLSSVALDCQSVTPRCRTSACTMTVTMQGSQLLYLLRELPDVTVLSAEARSRLRLSAIEVAGESHRGDAPLAQLLVTATPAPIMATTMRTTYPLGTVASTPLGGSQRGRGEIVADADVVVPLLVAAPADPFYLGLQASVPIQAGQPVPQGEYAMAVALTFSTTLGL
jgi:hypothetical protein